MHLGPFPRRMPAWGVRGLTLWISILALGGDGRAADDAKKVALLAGVNRYERRIFVDRPLQFAERDVLDLAAILRAQGFEVRTLTGSDATREKIDAALDATLKNRRPHDLVVLGFSGHGVQLPLLDGQDQPVLDNRGRALSDAYFCPVDAVFNKPETMVSLTRLFERLDREGGVNLIFADACRDDPAEASKKGAARSLSGDELVGRIPKDSAILFSCSASQQALETPRAGKGHGVFFHHVIEGLRGAAADRETGEVSWDDLVNYVRKNVNRRALEWFPDEPRGKTGLLQTPHMLSNLIATPVLVRRPALDYAASIGIKVVPIRPGEFQMGTTDEQIALILKQYPTAKNEFFTDEQPRHRVRITKLEGLSAYEITVGQFRRFVEEEGYKTEAERDGNGGYGYNAEKGEIEQAPKYTWRDPGFAQTDNHPVVNVSWNDAVAFCRWLSRKDGRTYRLPTEAEWEYGCRAGTETLYGNGDDPEGLATVGNVADASLKARIGSRYPTLLYNKSNDGHIFTSPIGSFAPNEWGLYDMHGNVAEWCLDNYDGGYYNKSDPADPRGPSAASDRVFRGGSWYYVGRYCRSAGRHRLAPDVRYYALGFRVARVSSE